MDEKMGDQFGEFQALQGMMLHSKGSGSEAHDIKYVYDGKYSGCIVEWKNGKIAHAIASPDEVRNIFVRLQRESLQFMLDILGVIKDNVESMNYGFVKGQLEVQLAWVMTQQKQAEALVVSGVTWGETSNG